MTNKFVDGVEVPLSDWDFQQAAKDYVDPTEAEAKLVRVQRNKLLSETDWTQVADAPVDQAAWATYRQALRDLSQQAGFPNDVTWPTKPE